MKRYLFLLLCLLLVVGCAYTAPHTVDHIMAVDKHGGPVDPENGQVMNDPEKVMDHVRRLLPEGVNNILIFIHGGLNIVSSSNERADRLTKPMQDQGYHPIFINWSSGFVATYQEHLFHIRQGEYWNFWGYVSSPFILVEDVGRGIIRAPMVWWYQTNGFIKSVTFGHYPGEKNALAVNRMLVAEEPKRFGEVPNVVDKNGELVSVRRRVLREGAWGAGKWILGLTTAPIFDGLGTGAWDDMKRRTELTVTRSRKESESSHDDVGNYVKEREGGLVPLFEELQRRQQNQKGLKIVLIGHSMGTIIANTILRQWPEIKYDRIVYMAAACSLKDFDASVTPQLRSNPDARFYNYMLHPIAENQEAHMYGLGGTGTLLNQIDNIYENAAATNHRTLGKWENVMSGINFFDVEDVRSRIYLRTMPLDDRYPTSHGDFDDAEFNNDTIGWFWQEDYGRVIKTDGT